jgi:hypothetical protein
MYTRLFCLVVIVSTLGAMLAHDTNPRARLYGKVKDKSGAVIPFAAVIVHRDRGSREAPDLSSDIQLKVNERGEYSVFLDPGLYDVAVFASIFSPQCAKVRVTEDAGRRDFTLLIDPELTKTEN